MVIEETQSNSSEVSARLYSVGQITLATSLGAPVAGCLLLARNYRALGKDAAVWQSLAAGVVSTILLMLIAFWLPENFPNMALPVAYCVGMRQLAQYLQGDVVSNHLKIGSRKGSWAIAVVVGLGCLIIISGLTVGLLIALYA